MLVVNTQWLPCTVGLIQCDSLLNFDSFLVDPTDLHTETIDNLTGLLIIRLEVAVCCEVGSQCGSLSQHCSNSTGYSQDLC